MNYTNNFYKLYKLFIPEVAYFTCYAFPFCIFMMALMMVTIISKNM